MKHPHCGDGCEVCKLLASGLSEEEVIEELAKRMCAFVDQTVIDELLKDLNNDRS